MSIECPHRSCLYHELSLPVCAARYCHFPSDIIVWPDGRFSFTEDTTYAERVAGKGDIMRIITNAISEEELDLVARHAANGHVRCFEYALKWFKTKT